MPFPAFAIDSLRRKIVYGYGAVAALVLGLSVFLVVDMRLLEAQITAGERIGQLFGTALEIRRFEKNYFLYHEAADHEENLGYVTQARGLLTNHGEFFAAFDTPERVALLRETLDDYARLMATHPRSDGDPLRESRIRQAGKEIVTITEDWARRERRTLQSQLDRHRQWLLASIGGVIALLVVIGQWLARRVARPLQQLEKDMLAIAAGRLTQLERATTDREIVSLVQAFNRMLHELELRQGQLVRAEKLAALGTLLSGVAHELNNPLSNISTSCEILKEEVGPDATAFQLELLQQIDAETWRARHIVRTLLDYARDRPLRRDVVALAPLVADSLRLMRRQLPDAVQIVTDIPANLTLTGDRQGLQQVLLNLLDNALAAVATDGKLGIRARPAHTPLPADALVFGQCPDGAAVDLEVSDNGTGIAPALLPRIFDPFFTTKDVGHGLGLGLFIVHEIVAEHGGCIAVQSTPGAGTRILLRIPTKDNHE